MDLKQTPLFEDHKRLGGKMVPFAGWEMPVQYSGVIAEHNAVRASAGLFDVSHMGEIMVEGPEAELAINSLTCNDLSTIYDGKAQYNAIINDTGGVVDDIIVYRFSKTKFLICVNASNSDKDFEWFVSKNKWDAKFENHSNRFGQIAIQGPKAVEITCNFFADPTLKELKYFHFKEVDLAGDKVIIARTGYTGEDGFELFVPWNKTSHFWNGLLEVGGTSLIPAGLGARDSLRLEACFPLYGHELEDDISALESGLGWIVKFTKDFTARDILESQKKNGLKRVLVGFSIEDSGIARQGDRIEDASGLDIGFVTSGTKTPTLNKSVGMAIIDSKFKDLGTAIFAVVRGRKLNAKIVKKPFYSALK